MGTRTEVITSANLGAIHRHHPYLLLLQKEDWQEYLLLLAQIYDLLEEQGKRVPIELVRSIAFRFYSFKGLASVDNKIVSFFGMTIGELQVLKDSHDQFGQRYIEATRAGKSLLQLMENLISQKSKYSGTGAESLLGSLNDILLSRKQMTEAEALKHHKDRIDAFKIDSSRIKEHGVAAAQLLPIAHSNEALFSQAEEAALHTLQSIEDVKASIEQKRKELADGYFQSRRSAGETLGAVADFYDTLYSSPQYASYVQAKELLSHLEGYQSRFEHRNVDRLVQTIETRELIQADMIKRSNLRAFMHQFELADIGIQDKIKEQIRILQQQVLYSMTTDVEGLRSTLHELLSRLLSRPQNALAMFESEPLEVVVRDDFQIGPIEVFDFELPTEAPSHLVSEVDLDREQERDLFLALARAEEGTLSDILHRLLFELNRSGELRSREHRFEKGLAEYYVLSEIELFSDRIVKVADGVADHWIDAKYGSFAIRHAPAFVLKRKESDRHGEN